MSELRAVVAEGVEPPLAPATRPPSRWVWLAIGLVAGFGLALVVLTRTDDPSLAAETDTTLVAPEPPIIGVRDYVPGFEDELVVVVVADGGKLEKLVWPARGEPETTPLPVAADSLVEIDESGRWLAVGSPVGPDGRLLLTTGAEGNNVALDSSATGFAWHDSDPASLAFTRVGDSGWMLMTARPPASPRPVDTPPGLGEGIVSYGDWGFAFVDPDSSTVVAPDGSIDWTASGYILDSHHAVGFVHLDGEIGIIGHDAVRYDVVGSFAQLGPIGAAISPDGTKVAVTGVEGVKVAPLDGSAGVTEMYTTAAPRTLTWTSDSRFVIVPMVRGITVIDTVQGRGPVRLLEHLQVVAVGVVPIDG